MELYHKEIITKAWIRVGRKIMPVTWELGKAEGGGILNSWRNLNEAWKTTKFESSIPHRRGTILSNFQKKMNEIKKIFGRRGCAGVAPLDLWSATASII